jgi:hypothetical protein
MPPSVLVADVRGKADGSAVAVGTLDGGQFFTQIGPTVPGGYNLGQTAPICPLGSVVRFRGQLFFIGQASGTTGSVWVFDEGGSNTWVTGVTAKGAQGNPGFAIAAVQQGSFTGLYPVNTGGQDYLVFGVNDGTPSHFWRYNPDLGANGTWAILPAAQRFQNTQTQFGFVYKGTFHLGCTSMVGNNARNTFTPATGASSALTDPGGPSRGYPGYFTLEDRLFAALTALSDTPSVNVEEFSLGAWAPVGAAIALGGGAGANPAIIQLADNSVLIFGAGGTGPVASNGLKAFHATLPSPGGTPTFTDVTATIVPATLQAPGPFPTPASYRVFGFADNDSVTGTPTFWLMFHPDGVSASTPSTLIQVFDEATPMLIIGAAGSDSDYAFPNGGYGSGERYNGIDGTTRLVTVSPRGYSQGTTGLVVKFSAHGDGVVLAHDAVAGGPYVAGELLTGLTSGATATVAGDGAAEGLYIRVITGTFLAGETVSGGTSGATSVLDTVIDHDATVGGIPYQIGEEVTGGTSGATGDVTHLGIGGAGEVLIKMDNVVGTFQLAETLTGGTSGAVSNSTSAPRGFAGGSAVKKVRMRYFLGANDSGIGVSVSGYAKLVPGSGVNCTVSIGTGPGGSDECIGIIAEGGVGGDAKISAEWDFLGQTPTPVPNFKTDQVQLEIDRE